VNRDGKILEEFKKGELLGLYSSMYRPLLSFASKCLTDKLAFLAEDCTQEAIYKAYLSKEDFKTLPSLRSFLYTTVHNKAIDLIRKNTSRENYLMSRTDRHEDLSDKIIEQETMRILFELVDTLSEKDKELFFFYSNGMTTSEIALKLNLSESAVKKRKAKMIQTLRNNISDEKSLTLALFIVGSGSFLS